MVSMTLAWSRRSGWRRARRTRPVPGGLRRWASCTHGGRPRMKPTASTGRSTGTRTSSPRSRPSCISAVAGLGASCAMPSTCARSWSRAAPSPARTGVPTRCFIDPGTHADRVTNSCVVAQRLCLHLPHSIWAATGEFGATIIEVLAAATAVGAGLRVPSMAAAAPQPKDDPFYSYPGPPPLASIAPGTVLKTRSIPYHAVGVPTLLTTTQLLYRSTSQTGNPTVNVTSVIQPPIQLDKTKVTSYQSAYDSLNQNDEPSHAISGGLTLG